jgi:hypothetical protein
MKTLLLSLAVLCYSSVQAQVEAVDFTAEDCSGVTHNLFTELDSGKIVILAWVMPCVGCIEGAVAADSAVVSLGASFGEDVLLYVIDDGPPSNCGVVVEWSLTNNLRHAIVFGNYLNEIDQDLFGGYGMPHVVVIGPDKQIYFNEMNGQGNGIFQAVANAANLTASIENDKNFAEFTLRLVPADNKLFIDSRNPIQEFRITDLNGTLLLKNSESQQYISPLEVSTASFIPGVYFLQLTDIQGNKAIRKFIISKN